MNVTTVLEEKIILFVVSAKNPEIWSGGFWRSLRKQKSYRDKLWIYYYKTLVEGSRRLTHIKISDVRTIKKSFAED